MVEVGNIGQAQKLNIFDLLAVRIELYHQVFRSQIGVHHSDIRQLLDEFSDLYDHVCQIFLAILVIQHLQEIRVLDRVGLDDLFGIEGDIPQQMMQAAIPVCLFLPLIDDPNVHLLFQHIVDVKEEVADSLFVHHLLVDR